MRAYVKSLNQRDLRAMIALIFSIMGTMALTVVVVWIIWILWRGGWATSTAGERINKLGLLGVLVTVIMGLTMAGFGLAINRRSIKGEAFGASFEASGGDDPIPVEVKNQRENPVPVESPE